jgi:hypothetical protein
MALPKISVATAVPKIPKSYEPGKSFAHIFAEKKNIQAINADTHGGVQKVFQDMLVNHQAATKTLKSSLVSSDYSPDKLLKRQFTLGMFLLREQMYAKTVELTANSLKNFTQMQV